VKEVIGTGKGRKRKYLAYLSRSNYDLFGNDKETLLAWANEKKLLRSSGTDAAAS
jgi:hypothetical protein